mmetsp:Transcript_27913/g.43893  ORF Transcript_27913/g.43893 Transcript_27913/m.43893 type:complete len:85 (-) Transcript_27913:559-813(-)
MVMVQMGIQVHIMSKPQPSYPPPPLQQHHTSNQPHPEDSYGDYCSSPTYSPGDLPYDYDVVVVHHDIHKISRGGHHYIPNKFQD